MIYKPEPEDDFELLTFDNPADRRLVWSLDGTARASSWTPLSVTTGPADETQGCKRSDFPNLIGTALAMRPSAVEALKDIFEQDAELLPLRLNTGEPLYLLHVKRVLDALNLAESDVLFVPGTDILMTVRRPAFREDVIAGVNVFRLPFGTSATYVSRAFKARVDERRLRGARFELVWGAPN